LNDRRNEIIHGIWGYEKNQPKELRLLYIRKVRERILPRSERKTSEDIKSIATKIDDLNNRLIQLHTDVGAPLP